MLQSLVMRVGTWSVLALLFVACSNDDDARPSDGGSTGGTMGTGGGTATGGRATGGTAVSTGGGALTDASPEAGSRCSLATKPFCIQFCGSDYVARAVCEGAAWRCPEDFVDTKTCLPSLSCGMLMSCCGPERQEVFAACVDGGQVCPPNYVPSRCADLRDL